MTHSSPITSVWAHALCRDCGFKSAGTHEDVAAACRAHRHPNSSFLVAPNQGQREKTWKQHFEARPPLMVDVARLPQPHSPLHIWGKTFSAVIVTGAVALLSRWLVSIWYPSVGALVHGPIMLLVVGGLVNMLLRCANDHRAADIQRFRTVAECNHQIRNALQVLSLSREARGQLSPEVSRHAADSVHRIELTLAEVLPRVLQGHRPGA